MSEVMREIVTLMVNGKPVTVEAGTTVAAAVMISRVTSFRRSVTGQPRGPLCGMGICYECRVTIDGHAHSKSCQILCRDGMEVMSDE